MRKSDRALLIALAVFVATFAFGALFAEATFGGDVVTERELWFATVCVTLAAIGTGAATAMAWSRVESWATPRWPERSPSVRFCSDAPDVPVWGDGYTSPRAGIARIEGQLLHRRIVLAAHALLTEDHGGFRPHDGLAVTDRGEPFQAVVRRLRPQWENAPTPWLIIVRDPARAGEAHTTQSVGERPVTRPAVLAAVITSAKGRRSWRIDFEELYLLDAAVLAEGALGAWWDVADARRLATEGARATATFCDLEGLTWEIELQVPATERDAAEAEDEIRRLLAELPVPVDVRVTGTLPDND